MASTRARGCPYGCLITTNQSNGHPSVKAIIYFGLPDSGVVESYAGLLDADYNPKQAWDCLKHLIWDEWTTEASRHTDANGTFAFRGFYGTYEVTVQSGDRLTKTDLTITLDQTNRFSLMLS